jgi:hypothetical protein
MTNFFWTIPTLLALAVAPQVQIEESTFQDRPHFRIVTAKAEYWLDRRGGGLSRMIDEQGNDWIDFAAQPLSEFPVSAASGYRGIPNAVFRGDDSGCGHPGFDRCASEQVDEKTIRCTSTNGTWQWTWTFEPTHATWEVTQADSTRAYWCLYEGPPAGRFAPEQQSWWTDQHREPQAFGDFLAKQVDHGCWRWVAIRDADASQQLLLVPTAAPEHRDDMIGLMGNSDQGLKSSDGMVVLGFGRTVDTQPTLQQVPWTLTIAFRDATDDWQTLEDAAVNP